MTVLQVMQMGQRKNNASYEYNDTLRTLLVALFFSVCSVLAIESIAGDAKDAGWLHMDRVPAWQLHMGAACVGIMTFFVFLYILELLETKSRLTAWRSSAPWLPLVGLTALTTVVHISFCVVLLVSSGYAAWAYRRTCSVRRSSGSPKGREIA